MEEDKGRQEEADEKERNCYLSRHPNALVVQKDITQQKMYFCATSRDWSAQA
jgi:hypothetical protein